jgi:peroxiredoxin
MQMSGKNKAKTRSQPSPLPLIIIGSGLILIAIAVVVLVFGGEVIPDAGTETIMAPASVNYPAPEIELVDLGGKPVSLAGLSGQVVLVNNWATWCPPCRAEMPALEAYYREHKDHGFTIVGINSGDSQDQVADFRGEYDLTFPLWLDPAGYALRAFQNNALPSSYLIDQNGMVRLIWMGAINLDVLEEYVTPFLALD